MDIVLPIMAHSFEICLLTEAFITYKLVEVVNLCNQSKFLVRQKGKYTNPYLLRQ